jgi:branched-chain amino acid transport system ATP-binding protein
LALLEIRNVTKDFGGLVAIKGVSFKLEKNEIVGLIGPNGAGKTTLFNIITGMTAPDSGDVLFEGMSIVGRLPHSISKLGIARTFQTVRPFLNHTVRQNIAVGAIYGHRVEENNEKPPDSDKRIEEVLQLLNLKSREDKLAKNLPIEERKMVEVGRALAANPKLLMLDEPMAGLNPSEVSKFVELIKSLSEKGIAILIVEHVMKAISSACTRVIVLHHGEMLAEGIPSAVLSNEHVIDVYLGDTYAGYKKSGT